MAIKKPPIIDRRKSALGYPDRTRRAGNQRPISGIRYIAWHYTGSTNSFITNHENFWRRDRGWGLGGYTYYISRDGTIYQNYDWNIRTNGVQGHNTHALNFSVEASSASNYTQAQIKAREHLTLWLMQELNIPASNVLGHKEFSGQKTSCPGYTKAQMNAYRADLAKKSGGNYKPSSPSNSLAGARKVKDEHAYFILTENIKIRDKPDTAGKHIRTAKKGARIEYYAVYEGNGYRWLEFKEGKSKLYIPYRPLNSSTAWGTFEAIPDIPKEKQLQKYVGRPEQWKDMKIGDTVTIRKGANRWLNANLKQMEVMEKDFTDVQDTISKIRDVKIGYSEKAYYLKTLKVWILEQDLVEPRAVKAEKIVQEEKQEASTLYRVQVGAYRSKANADKQLAKLKKAGFDGFITEAKRGHL